MRRLQGLISALAVAALCAGCLPSSGQVVVAKGTKELWDVSNGGIAVGREVVYWGDSGKVAKVPRPSGYSSVHLTTISRGGTVAAGFVTSNKDGRERVVFYRVATRRLRVLRLPSGARFALPTTIVGSKLHFYAYFESGGSRFYTYDLDTGETRSAPKVRVGTTLYEPHAVNSTWTELSGSGDGRMHLLNRSTNETREVPGLPKRAGFSKPTPHFIEGASSRYLGITFNECPVADGYCHFRPTVLDTTTWKIRDLTSKLGYTSVVGIAHGDVVLGQTTGSDGARRPGKWFDLSSSRTGTVPRVPGYQLGQNSSVNSDGLVTVLGYSPNLGPSVGALYRLPAGA